MNPAKQKAQEVAKRFLDLFCGEHGHNRADEAELVRTLNLEQLIEDSMMLDWIQNAESVPDFVLRHDVICKNDIRTAIRNAMQQEQEKPAT